MIRCSDISVSINETVILDKVGFEVADGAWLGVIGPNGAGKSTLMKVLADRQHHTGSVDFGVEFGREAGRERSVRSRLVAYLEQIPVVPPGMYVADYVMLGRTPYLSRFGTERESDRAVVRRVLDRLDLSDMAGRTLETLSGGERQRALIGRALAQEAPVVLLDEPTTALDLGHQQEVLELLDELRRSQNLTLISTMHDLTLAGQYPDELLMLDGGRVVARGTPESVLTPELITNHYGAQVEVENGYVRPIRRR